MGQRVGLLDVLSALADDHAKLDLPIGLDRSARDLDIVVRTADGRGPLVEDDRLLRDCGARLGGVVGIVQADADELADPSDAGPDPGIAADGGQVSRVERGNFRQPVGRQHVAGDVVHMGRQVADGAARIEKSGLFLPFRAISQELHPCLFRRGPGAGQPPAALHQS